MRIITIIAILASINAKAQYISASLISSSGDLFKANNIQIEWTLGDLAIDTYKNGNFITQGFIQGANKLTIGQQEIANIKSLNALKAYPNPFNDGFNLEVINTKPNDNISICVYDVIGKEVFNQNHAEAIQYINLSHLAASIYIVKVNVNNELAGSLKINKL
jgi:hypothetical protein